MSWRTKNISSFFLIFYATVAHVTHLTVSWAVSVR